MPIRPHVHHSIEGYVAEDFDRGRGGIAVVLSIPSRKSRGKIVSCERVFVGNAYLQFCQEGVFYSRAPFKLDF
jgi:hypothetical protein